VGKFVGFDREEGLGVVRMVVDHVVLEVVGVAEAQFAIRALVDVFGHDGLLAVTATASPGPHREAATLDRDAG
jgi:hypothetical protein